MKQRATRIYGGGKKEENHCKCCKKSMKKWSTLICSLCDYKTKGHTTMKIHITNEHGNNSNKNLDRVTVKCQLCTFETSTNAGLGLHMYMAHKQNKKREEVKECQECGFKS